MLYVVGQGVVPWQGRGEMLDSRPLPQRVRPGGLTTLPYQYSAEPLERFSQMAGNMSPASAAQFMLGRRLHHTDFDDGGHSEQPNRRFDEQVGKLGPRFVARSCIACHVHNGRNVFDARLCDAKGNFKTGPLVPGDYNVVVAGYQSLTQEELGFTGSPSPRYHGFAQVTIPESGAVPTLEMALKDARAD